MKKDLISIIVPVYKVEQYLNKCIDSIVSQTYRNIEIILVDDGSPDLCPQICDGWAEKDERIIVIHKKNGGLSDARNTGIENAQGIYLSFVDSDDYIDRTMIAKLYARIKKDHSELALCGVYSVDFEKGRKGKIEPFLDFENSVWNQRKFWDHYYHKESRGSLAVAWNKLYLAELFQEERYDVGKIHEDEFIIHRLIAQCKRISVLSDRLYYYVKRQGSITCRGNLLQRVDAMEAALIRSQWFIDKQYFNYAFMNLGGFPYSLSLLYVGMINSKNSELQINYRKMKLRYNKLKLQCCLAGNVKLVYRIKFFIKDILFNLNATLLYHIVEMKKLLSFLYKNST